MIIAMRLHSLIYAASQGIPMVGIVYDPKIEGFFKICRYGLYVPCRGHRTPKFNWKKIDIVWSNREKLKKNLAKLDEHMKKKKH